MNFQRISLVIIFATFLLGLVSCGPATVKPNLENGVTVDHSEQAYERRFERIRVVYEEGRWLPNVLAWKLQVTEVYAMRSGYPIPRWVKDHRERIYVDGMKAAGELAREAFFDDKVMEAFYRIREARSYANEIGWSLPESIYAVEEALVELDHDLSIADMEKYIKSAQKAFKKGDNQAARNYLQDASSHAIYAKVSLPDSAEKLLKKVAQALSEELIQEAEVSLRNGAHEEAKRLLLLSINAAQEGGVPISDRGISLSKQVFGGMPASITFFIR